MKRLRLLLLSMSLLTASCFAPPDQVIYHFEPPSDTQGLACLRICQATRATCETICRNRHPECFPENRSPDQRSRQDPLATVCRGECDCAADYRACYRLCGGRIYEQDVTR